MKMTGIFLTTLFLFHLVLIPSKAFTFSNPFQNAFFGPDQGRETGLQMPFKNPFAGTEQPPEENQGGGDDQQEKPVGKQPFFNAKHKLKQGFYRATCPNAEKIVADALAEMVKTNPSAIANFIRLQFHDCFVNGCDASVLLDFSPAGDKVEKNSMFNGFLLKGADLIDDIKTKLEEECPETVSCADTLAFATNEAMALAGVPRQRPLGGRRDALVSLASVAEDNNLPSPNWSVDQMIELFNRKGFNAEELVVLLGAHSVGSAHCDLFMDRLYNFKNSQKPDPTLIPPVVDELKQICKNPGTPQFRNPPVNFDETPTKLDNLFYKNMVEKKKSLLLSDSFLLGDPRTGPVVRKMAAEPGLFPKKFAEVMVKLCSLNVLTGNDGEIRKTCRSTN
ncbi:peroxidase 28-like [Gastrolobium bilobum]|uniref:peroxidase 28-like n=1 Tax=Gastrolobium bilobum TaxID=150636 RepID=UPI002AB2CA89|nr:peroxidase 28-like [Gastrolobium bilobum]